MLPLLAALLAIPTASAEPSPDTEEAAAPDKATMLASLLDTARALDDAVSESRGILLGLQSVEGEYSRYEKVEAVTRELRKAKDAVHRVNVLIPASQRTATRYGEMEETELKALFERDLSDAERYIFSLRSDLETWSEARLKAARLVNDGARESLDQAKDMFDDPRVDQRAAMGTMEMWVIGFHGPMLDAVPLLLPTASENPDTAVPLSDEEKAERARTEGLVKEIEGVAAKVAAVKAAIAKAHLVKVGAARFPKGEAPSEAGVGAALAGEFGKPLRMAKYAPWMEREETYWTSRGWRVEHKKYLSVWLAAKTPKGATYVYLTQVVSKKKSDGSWGPIRYRGVSDSFEMLPENLMK